MDPIKELEGLIKELAAATGSVGAIKQKQEEIEAKLANYDELMKRGFTLPGARAGMDQTELKEIFGQFDHMKQGQRLMDKFYHPNHTMSDETRMEVAKYFVLFLRATVLQNRDAQVKMHQMYQSKATTTDVGDAGNVFILPDIVDSEILHYAREASVILQFARIWDMTSDKQSFPTEIGAASTYWGNTTPESNPELSEFELDNEELSAYAAVRNDTLLDARSDIVSWLAEALAEALGQTLDTAGFTGTGDGAYGGISGLLSAAVGYSVTMSGSTRFDQLSADHLSLMIAKLDGLKKQGARFFMSGQILHYVRTLKDSQGRPIFMDGHYGTGVPGTIFGYPYSEVITMPTTTGTNTPFVVFGNMKCLGVGRRVSNTALQVDPYGLWTTNRTRFKIYNRWAIGVALPKGFVRLLTNA
jgi:HK97 family phage major capsid protein